MELNDDTILGFWQWFVKNERTIKECIENDNSVHREFVVEQLNERILSFGMLTWDIGLNEDDNWFLTLSPNGNKDILKISQSIMAEAPDHMDWIFHASKPAKNWNRQFSVYDDYLDEQLVDASNWHYLIFEDGDGKLALVLEAGNVMHLDQELAETAAEKFVIHEIGELHRIQFIGSVEIVAELESEHAAEKTPVTDLKEHLLELIQ
ncbi:MAG: hypothetical protein QNL61_06180 [Crocinitomicaceae bacterium]